MNHWKLEIWREIIHVFRSTDCNCLKKREGYLTDVIYAMDNMKLLVRYS